LGSYQQAFAQTLAVLTMEPSDRELATLRALLIEYPQIREAGLSSVSRLLDTARTEPDLLKAQSEVRAFAKLGRVGLCDADTLASLRSRYVTTASRLILDAGIPVTFASNLVADWEAATGRVMDPALERRIYRHTLADIAARPPAHVPAEIVVDRLCRYLLRNPEARDDAFDTLRKVEWQSRDLTGPLREVYPSLVEERWKVLEAGSSAIATGTAPGEFGNTIQFDTKGVEFGPWVRRVLAQVRSHWFISNAESSLSGHVVVSFDVRKDGTITDVAVTGPCNVDAFNTASASAVAKSSPVLPLPAEYPDEKVRITVTFYYNEYPGQKR
jgi:TonB family protein